MRDGAFLEQPYAFSHDRETASCGYYSVELPDEGLTVELTAATRTACTAIRSMATARGA